MSPRSAPRAALALSLLLGGVLPGLLPGAPASAQEPAKVQKVRTQPAAGAERLHRPEKARKLQPLDPASASSVFEAFGAGVQAGDAASLRALLAEAGLRVRLRPDEPPAAAGEEEPTYSREQVYFMLQSWLGEGGREVLQAQCDCPGPGDGVDDAHGVLDLKEDRRLFLRLRAHEGRWRVVELRALP